MAFKICVKLCVFLYIFICAEKQTFASTDGTYNVRASEFQEISVIDLEHARHRRQTSSDDSTTTTTQKIPTTSPDLNEFNILHDDHSYYESLMFKASNVNDYWVELKDVTGHSTLSDSHRTAVTAKLPFKFPFYGHPIDNVTIATGGFLYMSPFLHQWLTATQYVAPLMANFDTRIGNTSNIYFSSMDQNQKFVVEWRDVHLQDQNGTGSFHFQVILHVNGSITFVYKKLGLKIISISSDAHKVTVGLSDAFYVDTVSPEGTKRRTIYEYHRIALNTTRIEEGTIVIINPQPTCNKFSDCESCVTSKIGFECRWCGIIKKCSDSVDWHRQEWLNAGCVHLSREGDCQAETTTEATNLPQTSTMSEAITTNLTNPAFNSTTFRQTTSVVEILTSKHISTFGTTPPWLTTKDSSRNSTVANNSAKPETTTGHPSTVDATTATTTFDMHIKNPCQNTHMSGAGNCSSIPTALPATEKVPESPGKLGQKRNDNSGVGAQIGVIIVVVVVVVALIGGIGGWIYYAYTHPTSASGMWLMEHRPSQMKAKLSNMKFWKRNGTAGDKYAVESTA